MLKLGRYLPQKIQSSHLKADCSLRFCLEIHYLQTVRQLCVLFSSGLRLNNFVAFILTGYLLSTRMIRNRMCSELRILFNFLLG